MSIVLQSSGGGQITIQEPATASNFTQTLPAATGTVALTNAPVFTGQATIPTINLTGGQITFPATQSASSDANTLDDYEEGTWTPNQGAGMTTTGTFASSGIYVKVGQLVNFQCTVSATTISIAGGSNFLSGLPFPVNSGGGTISVAAYSNQSNTLTRLMFITGTGLYCIGATSSGDTNLYLSGSYRTNT